MEELVFNDGFCGMSLLSSSNFVPYSVRVRPKITYTVCISALFTLAALHLLGIASYSLVGEPYQGGESKRESTTFFLDGP